MKILLVEDNPGDARLVHEFLREADGAAFDTVTATTLAEAVQQLGHTRFDAVLLDLSLPDSHGLETVRRLQASHSSVPAVVVLSGLQDESVALEAVRQGAQDYLVKGMADGHVMARVVRYAMERKRTEAELRRARDELEQRVAERTHSLRAANLQLQQEVKVRQRVERVVRRERDFTSAILDTVGALVVVLDTEGRIVRFNRACEHTTGYQFAEVQGMAFWNCFLLPQEAESVRAIFEGLVKDQAPSQYENYLVTKSGERRLVAWSNTVLQDEHGAVEAVIGTGIDITDQKRAEEMAVQRQAELAHVGRLSTMGEMATEIAHELNQPLFAISSYADACLRLYRMGGAADPEITGALEAIVFQAERAGQVIQRIRNFVRKEAPQSQPLVLTDIAREVIDLTAVEVRSHQVTLLPDLAASLPTVNGDRVLVEQVVVNLVRNAIEAMGALKPGRRRLRIRTWHGGGYSHLAVADSGPGIESADLGRVFDAFYTTKSSGMGMGLSISRSIVDAHGGRLWAQLNEWGGTTFEFVLPCVLENDQHEEITANEAGTVGLHR